MSIVLVVLQSLPFYRCTCCWRHSLTLSFNSIAHSLRTPPPQNIHSTRNKYMTTYILHSSHFAAACITHIHQCNSGYNLCSYVAWFKARLPGREWCADKRNWNMSSEDWKWILPFRSYSLYIVYTSYARSFVLSYCQWPFWRFFSSSFFLVSTENKYHVI